LAAGASLDETHDPNARSWVVSANTPDCPFPIQNLPYGSFRPGEAGATWRLGVAIGDQVLDLSIASALGFLDGLSAALKSAAAADRLNPLLELGPVAWSDLRRTIFAILSTGYGRAAMAEQVAPLLRPIGSVELHVPMIVGDYTDFFASIHHARRTARIIRGAADVSPNYRRVPIGYHGRASSIIVTGTPIVRPRGVRMDDGHPQFGPTQRLDYELEMAAVIGGGNPLGRPIPVDEAERHLFGLCLLNDWSARDIQAFEAQPLGPFLAKSFATTISPWIVTTDALAPFRVPLEPHGADDPEPLPHLRPGSAVSGFQIRLTAAVATRRMRVSGCPAEIVTDTRFDHLYWSFAQMIAHHTGNGCNLRSGDLLGTGTISGPPPQSAACLLERSETGPLVLSTGESRTFLEDGDVVSLCGTAERPGRRSIGFGDCSGEILPAIANKVA